jgi:hypothetical protein
MRRLTTKAIGTFAALTLGATLASAQPSDRSTIVTFSAPVSMPGVTLPAGSYLFKLADSQVNRNVVQVFDKDRSKIYATIIAIPAERNEPADETVITFNEAPANTAPAVRYWYYPGEKRGQEFAYPKSQAVLIANAARTSVLAVDTESANIESMKSGEISRVEPSAAETQAPAQAAQPAEPASPAPTAQTAPARQPEASTPVGPSSVGTSGRTDRLPATASPLPLVGFAGLLALGAACGVRAVRRVRA